LYSSESVLNHAPDLAPLVLSGSQSLDLSEPFFSGEGDRMGAPIFGRRGSDALALGSPVDSLSGFLRE
jgi:hypothetical protein